MKKIVSFAVVVAGALFLLSSCNKDCVCHYYDNNHRLLNTEVFDGDEVSTSECADLDGGENVAVEVHDNTINASYVSCKAQ